MTTKKNNTTTAISTITPSDANTTTTNDIPIAGADKTTSFNQIFRLDAITEVSRETSISQIASSSDVDVSVTSSDVRMTSSLLGAPTAKQLQEKESLEESSFAPQTTVPEEPAVVEDEEEQEEAAVKKKTKEQVPVKFSEEQVAVENSEPTTVIDKEQVAVVLDKEQAAAKDASLVAETPMIEQPAESKRSSIVVETVEESLISYNDVETGGLDAVPDLLDKEPDPQEPTTKQEQNQAPCITLDIPPAMPTPVKKESSTPTTTTYSPSNTEPLSPDKENLIEPHTSTESNNNKDNIEVETSGNVCGSTRSILIGSLLLVLAALVGIVVAITTGNGSDDSAAAVETPRAPTFPTQGGTPVTTVVPPSVTIPATSSSISSTPMPPTNAGTVPPPVATGTPTSAPRNQSPSAFPTFALTSEAPTTAQPTLFPTTTGPTFAPTVAETAAPSMAPTTTLATLLPLLAGLTPLAVLQDPTTVQGQAALWVASQGGVSSTSSAATVLQQYVVSVLDRATNGGPPRVSGAAVNTCDWTGISCVNGTIVTAVNWADSGLTGSIPNEIAGLTHLQTLDLGENALAGSLPTGLFACTQLEYLYLHQNQLSGGLTKSFASLPNLVRLYLGNNQFTGRLPQAFGSQNALNARGLRPLRKYIWGKHVFNVFPTHCRCLTRYLICICFPLRLFERKQQ